MSYPYGPAQTSAGPPAPGSTAGPAWWKRRPVQVSAVIVVIAAVVVGIVLGTASGKPKHHVTGQVSVARFIQTGSTCAGDGKFSRIKAGGYAVLYEDDRQDFLASAQLSPGKVSAGTGKCVFTFDFGSVKETDEYSVVVGDGFEDIKTQAGLRDLGYTFDLDLPAY